MQNSMITLYAIHEPCEKENTMNSCRSAICTFGIGLFIIAAISTHALSMGFSGVGSAPCNSGGQNINGTFSSKGAKYFTTGTCTTNGSLGVQVTFPFKAEGRFADNIAVETIEMTPASIDRPSHPYGKWTTTYSCPTDPWLTPDPFPLMVEEPVVKCQVMSKNDFSPTWSPSKDGKPNKPLDNLFNAWRKWKPITSYYLTPPQRTVLTAKRDKDLNSESEALAKAKAEKRRAAQLLQGAKQATAPYRSSLFPIVRSPVAGQRFFNQTAVPIKLAPPPQWADTNSGLDGKPIKTAESVTGYMVRLERKDPAGNWMAHTTLPVGAVQAESAAGYTGFGAGAPPGGITTPGAWRMSAQVSSPRQSGWSEWVEFVVMAPATNKVLQPPTKSFGK